MLDIRQQSSTSDVEIGKFGLKKSGEDGKKLVDLDLVEVIETEEEALAIDPIVPGTLQLWRGSHNAQAAAEVETKLEGAAAGAQAASAELGPFGTYTIPLGDDGVRITLGERDHVVDVPLAEILSYRVKSTARICVLSVKVRLEGLDREQISYLVEMFGETMKVTIERRQGALPFRRRDAPGGLGEIVSGIHDGVEYAGILAGRSKDDDGREMIEVDDCGAVYLVPATTISGSFPSGDAAIRNQRVEEFKEACAREKKRASWRSLVTALGAAYLASPPPNGQWTLTAEIVAAAVSEAPPLKAPRKATSA